MGRIFTDKQIEQGLLPTRTDFAGAVAGLCDAVEIELDQGSVVSTVVYGSVTAGSPNYRSDCDAVVVCRDFADLPAAARISHQAYLASNETVPMGVVAYTRDELAGGRHEIDRFFGRHLTTGNRIVLGEDVADYIQYAPKPAGQIFRDYIRDKKRGLSERYVGQYNDPTQTDTLIRTQRLLELPMAVGRKLLAVLAEIEAKELVPQNTAEKPRMRTASMAVYGELGVADFAHALFSEDQRYTHNVELLANRAMDSRMYDRYIWRLFGMIPQALQWLDDVDQAFGVRVGD